MSEQTFSIKLDVDNIGPHFGDKKIAFSDEVDSNKAIFFASNGTGKSFISRAFRLTSAEKQAEIADDLLTLGQAKGNLAFQIIKGTNEKKLSIAIARGKAPVIQNDTGLIFHVFNSDFVEENIKPKHYTPDGNIEGYILGKTHIDLTEEKKAERAKKLRLDEIGNAIDKLMLDAQEELRTKGVKSSTIEYGLIERSQLRDKKEFEKLASFDEIVEQLAVLSKVPENLPDVQAPILSVNQTVSEEVAAILKTAYPKTEWDEEFVEYYKTHRQFIDVGVELSGSGNICPFCKQPYGTDALSLVHQYKAYMQDKEAEILRRIEQLAASVSNNLSALKKVQKDTKAAIGEIANIKKYFPSLGNTVLDEPELSEEEAALFTRITELLNLKAADLPAIFDEIDSLAASCKSIVERFASTTSKNEDTIKTVNTVKNNANGERLLLRRNLCKAQFLRLQVNSASSFTEFDEVTDSLAKLRENILEKEQQERVSKRDKVYETLTFFLNRFFSGKYNIDKDTFQVKFMGSSVGKNASNILSDGEKSIVAFCYYLASTHVLIAQETDYNQLFFVIDDPISSMDFHFVYAVAQSLRDIKEYFGITSFARMWVFTHNMEFLSIVARNYIISNVYVMKPGKIEQLKHQLLMPYESHLQDIVAIAAGKQSPSHTTANSIRHVLETVSRFEYPERSIEKYISENSILSQDSCIFTLCQDLSHGGIRSQPPFSAEILVAACKTVVAFMNSKYEGQVKAISQMIAKAEA